jgi:lysine-N-methylase
MSWPVRHLPVLQNWDCHACTNCCREYNIRLTEEDYQRIASQGWERDAAFQDRPVFVRTSGALWGPKRYRLNHHEDGRCVFLSDEGRCRIHERFGAAAKPLACRVFPFVLVPAGDHWRVGLRFACPSVAANKGRPLASHEAELAGYAAEPQRLHLQGGGRPAEETVVPPPPLQAGQRLEWPDLLRFAQALLTLIRDRRDPLDRRIRKWLALARLCRQAKFDKVRGGRLSEFLNLLTSGLDSEVPADPGTLPPPSWVGRVLFRQVLAIYSRVDHGPNRGSAPRSLLARAGGAWRFARGSGPVPRLNARLPETTFEQIEESTGRPPEAAEQLLERYYAIKAESLQFCGPSQFGLSFWDGVEALALTLPVVLWLARAFRDLPRDEAVRQAVSIVDNHFGFNPLLGSARQRLGLRILARNGELERLIGWYSR